MCACFRAGNTCLDFKTACLYIYIKTRMRAKGPKDIERVIASNLLGAQCYFQLFVGQSSSGHWKYRGTGSLHVCMRSGG